MDFYHGKLANVFISHWASSVQPTLRRWQMLLNHMSGKLGAAQSPRYACVYHCCQYAPVFKRQMNRVDVRASFYNSAFLRAVSTLLHFSFFCLESPPFSYGGTGYARTGGSLPSHVGEGLYFRRILPVFYSTAGWELDSSQACLSINLSSKSRLSIEQEEGGVNRSRCLPGLFIMSFLPIE